MFIITSTKIDCTLKLNRKCYAGGTNSQRFIILSTEKFNRKCYAGGTTSQRFIITTDNSLKMLRWKYKLPNIHNHFDRKIKIKCYAGGTNSQRFILTSANKSFHFKCYSGGTNSQIS